MNLNRQLHNFMQNLKALELFNKAQREIKNDTGSIDLDDLDTAIEVLSHFTEKDISQEKVDDLNEKYESSGFTFELTEDDNNKKEVSFRIANEETAKRFNEVVQFGDITYRKEELVNRNSLTSLMTFFENLVAGIIRLRLTLHPDSFNPKEKSIKYSDLLDFESIEEALEHLIEQEVMEIMYGGLKSWITYFNKAGINTKRVNALLEEVNEASLRRNLVVHNDGIVNKVYLSKVDSKLIEEGISKGTRLKISKEYLESKIMIIKIYGTIILLESWKKLDKLNFKEAYVDKLAYDAMRNFEWEFAKYIYEFLFDNVDSYAYKKALQFNIWLCEKELGNFESIKEDIEKCDVGGLKTHYQLCRLSLLDRKEDFYDLLDTDPNCITKDKFMEWPILKYIRDGSRYEEFIKLEKEELVN
ncbi:hypothetical protein [Lysinibacillus sphaericus]|uniref:hypothetical protein n=1 Tax=Lysinibacillus sphaericus TaxID=1421 RepID=UPI002DC02D9F|nr:hypothetical protein [Lysinibacillus sphaericus]MEB7455120.1 hypothetical protein [Lysinibacillus sphaericus]